MIKTVFLDLDDTLFDFHRAEAIAIRTAMKKMGIEPTEDTVKRYSEINLSCWKKLERGEMDSDQVLHTRFALLFSELGVDYSPEEAQKIYEYELGSHYFYLDGAEELLENIYKRYDLYITTNGITVVQSRRIADSGIAKYFKDIFISQEIGYNKPQKEYFDSIFKTIDGFKKEEAIIIGDSLSSDILGGINAGIKTCRYNPNRLPNAENIIPDYEIQNLSELPALLEAL